MSKRKIPEKTQLRTTKSSEYSIAVDRKSYKGPYVTKAMAEVMRASRWHLLFCYKAERPKPLLAKLRKRKSVAPADLALVMKKAGRVRQITFRPDKVDGLLIEYGDRGTWFAVPADSTSTISELKLTKQDLEWLREMKITWHE